jgi:TonB family protein
MIEGQSSYKRMYFLNNDSTLIEDYKNNVLEQKGVIYGLDKIEQVNELAWFAINSGGIFNYKPYFSNVDARFWFYNGKATPEKLIEIKKGRYSVAQVWNDEGKEMLINGTGQNTYGPREQDKVIFEKYVDSTLVMKYGIRTVQKDTVYYKCDWAAFPREGWDKFYQRLSNELKYPGLARLLGKEGRIVVTFVVDKNGKLRDFKPLTNEGYSFEAKVIKKLEKFPVWSPALYRGQTVKTELALPVIFRLTD